MDMQGEGSYPSVPIDLEGLAAAIALASDALAAAAEALAEAARAMLDVSGTPDDNNHPKVFAGATSLIDVTENLASMNELETDSNFVQVDQHVPSGQSNFASEGDRRIPTTSSPAQSIISISADTRGEVELLSPHLSPDLDEQALDSSSPQVQMKDDLLGPDDTFGPELNNKLNVPQLLAAMRPYPMIPPGRNYIHLEHPSDALAFIAYMALQANRIICLVPGQILNACSELLQSLTNANLYRIDTLHHLQSVFTALATVPVPHLHDIVLVPYLMLNYLSPTLSHHDCLLHWGRPSNAYHWTTKVLNFLPYSARVCVMLVGEHYFNGLEHGVLPYPDAVLDTCHSPNSPFQLLRQISSDLLPRSSHASLMGPLTAGSRLNLYPSQPSRSWTPNIPSDSSGSEISLPAGHYYIVLDQANDLDIIPMVTYIALNSAKVICHIPINKNLFKYQRLIKLISGVNVMIPASVKSKQIKVATNRLKTERSGLLLRNATKDWYSFFSKSLVDCLIHCGVPADLAVYSQECRTKVNTSYLILTPSQYSSLQWKLGLNQWIKQHPYIHPAGHSGQGSTLYSLRRRLVSHL
ncbi:hypothetical protein OPQ81_002574 [Rhizoctonia solani]|nr:hypothetical protein OPQ81_002574 [Rhizoctonia solani]